MTVVGGAGVPSGAPLPALYAPPLPLPAAAALAPCSVCPLGLSGGGGGVGRLFDGGSSKVLGVVCAVNGLRNGGNGLPGIVGAFGSDGRVIGPGRGIEGQLTLGGVRLNPRCGAGPGGLGRR